MAVQAFVEGILRELVDRVEPGLGRLSIGIKVATGPNTGAWNTEYGMRNPVVDSLLMETWSALVVELERRRQRWSAGSDCVVRYGIVLALGASLWLVIKY